MAQKELSYRVRHSKSEDSKSWLGRGDVIDWADGQKLSDIRTNVVNCGKWNLIDQNHAYDIPPALYTRVDANGEFKDAKADGASLLEWNFDDAKPLFEVDNKKRLAIIVFTFPVKEENKRGADHVDEEQEIKRRRKEDSILSISEVFKLVDERLQTMTYNDEWNGVFVDPSSASDAFKSGNIPKVFYGSEMDSLDLVMEEMTPGLTVAHKNLRDSLLTNNGSRPVVGVGLSGCGKTTTHFGLAKLQYAMYFECHGVRVNQKDCHVLGDKIKLLKDDKVTEAKCIRAQNLLQALIAARFTTFVQFLKVGLREKKDISPLSWLCAQLNGISTISAAVFSYVVRLSSDDLLDYTTKVIQIMTGLLTDGLKRTGNDLRVFLLFDEVHPWFSMNEFGKYLAITDSNMMRPFLSRAIHTCRTMLPAFSSFWTGTLLSMAHLSDLQTSFGTPQTFAKDAVFLNFPPATVNDVRFVCSKYFRDDLLRDWTDEDFENLSGRGRLLATFLREVHTGKSSYSSSRAFRERLLSYFESHCTASVKAGDSPRTFYDHWQRLLGIGVFGAYAREMHAALVGSTRVAALNVIAKYLMNGQHFSQTIKIPTSEDVDFVHYGIMMASHSKSQGQGYDINAEEPLLWRAAMKVIDDYRSDLVPALHSVLTRFMSGGTAPIPTTAQENGYRVEKLFAFVLRLMKKPGAHVIHLIKKSIEDDRKQKRPGCLQAVPDWVQLLVNEFPEITGLRIGEDMPLADIEAALAIAYILLPPNSFGADLSIYRMLFGFKTTTTKNGRVEAKVCEKNQKTINPDNIYEGDRRSSNLHSEATKAISKWDKKRGIIRCDVELPIHPEILNNNQRTSIPFVQIVTTPSGREDLLVRVDKHNLEWFYDSSVDGDSDINTVWDNLLQLLNIAVQKDKKED